MPDIRVRTCSPKLQLYSPPSLLIAMAKGIPTTRPLQPFFMAPPYQYLYLYPLLRICNHHPILAPISAPATNPEPVGRLYDNTCGNKQTRSVPGEERELRISCIPSKAVLTLWPSITVQHQSMPVLQRNLARGAQRAAHIHEILLSKASPLTFGSNLDKGLRTKCTRN